MQQLIDQLAMNSDKILTFFEGISPSQARWKPNDQTWSLLEILHHLADEEAEDFRPRIQSLLENPVQLWPAIDPEGWVQERRYNEQDLSQLKQRFASERENSLTWLRGLETANWSATYEHPALGPLRAGDLLASWAIHDLLHLKQLCMRSVEYVKLSGKPYSTHYAMPD